MEVTVQISIIITIVVMILALAALIHDNRTKFSAVRENCPIGYCATSLSTGIKRCPSTETGVVERDNTTEVCNPRFFCRDERTPFAILSNGSTNVEGECETGVACGCSSKIICHPGIVTLFEVKGERIEQIPADLERRVPPLKSEDRYNQLCSIPPDALGRTLPRNCLVGTLGRVIESDNDPITEETPFSCIRTTCSAEDQAVLVKDTGRIACVLA